MSIDPGILFGGKNYGLGDERQESNPNTVLLLDLVDVVSAPGNKLGHVALIESCHVRNCKGRFDHVFGDDLAYSSNRNNFLILGSGPNETGPLIDCVTVF